MSQLKEVYKATTTRSAFFTGGESAWTNDGDVMFFQCGAKVQVVDVGTSEVISSIGEDTGDIDDDIDEDDIFTFTLSQDNSILVCAHKSKLFKMWNIKENKLVKNWRSMHKVPVSRLALSADCSVFASGATDASVRTWNLSTQACTYNLDTRSMQGVVSILVFYDDNIGSKLLFGSADNALIRAWDAETGAFHKDFKGHYSKVTSLIICDDNQRMVSCGRDKVFIVWEISSAQAVYTVPVYESLEGLAILSGGVKLPGSEKVTKKGLIIAVAGEKGVLRIWDAEKSKELYVKNEPLVSNEKECYIMKLMYCESRNQLAVIYSDHTVVVVNTKAHLDVDKQLVGFSDEILDVVLVGENESHMVVASNSPNIQVYSRTSYNCQLLKGHSDLVISLAVTPADRSLLVSGAKDNSIRVWVLSSTGVMQCVASGSRHTASVNAVALGNASKSLLVSASIDTTVKIWILPKKLKPDCPEVLNVKYTEIGHEKDINSVSISPNDKLIATGSLDKTAKLWNATNLSLIGVMKGHRRGIWSVKFSPVDQVLLTASVDTTMRLWSLSDLSCLKAFEGHESSVLCTAFITKGQQIISGGADGHVKLWSIKTSECVATFNEHDGKVWSLAVSKNENELVTGGSDSKLVMWKDATEEVREEAANKRQETVLQEQELSNLMHNKQLVSALKLALSLNRPATVLKIVNGVQESNINGLQEAMNDLDVAEKEILLKCASVWNTNTRNVHAAQAVISLLLSDITNRTIQIDKATMESLIVYTDRHFKHITQLRQDLKVLPFTADIMQPEATQLYFPLVD